MLEDLTGVVIGDQLVFDFAGMIGERDAVTVQGFGEKSIVRNLFSLP